ncbi:hypothetical protein MNBD_ALPHA02-1429 [hydrothermal vent metagenome]|uniref:Uncharacterized protein n=1 Tax=hydrothermal vent metagenome TaxID=652676 RepID=A0A3B0RZI8_9ZZZZ
MTQLADKNMLPSSETLELEAAEWIASLDKSNLFDKEEINIDDIAAQNTGFSEWLNISLSHRVALLRLLSVWKRTRRLATLKPSDALRPANGLLNFPHVRKIAGGLAIAASLFLALIFTINNQQDIQADHIYQTARGGHKSISLADGSVVVLNSDTRLTVEMLPGERVIILEKGEAFFEVFRDENRPFKIIAGDQIVTVLGTKFAVHRRAHEIETAVTEGRVQINILNARHEESRSVIIGKGDIAKTNQGTVLVVNKGLETVNRELSWRQGFIIFDKTPLKDAAAEFNRYNDRAVIIKDPRIADIRVSGKFKTDNLEAFVRLLTDGFGFHIDRENEDILISE